uniref:NADH dehydrogenase subunit 2b n=1 Tax=Strombidium cf. sulcatum TaxID=2793073 RepID=A0A7T0M4N0_9SPIT|nr:NADH dehydrogenase subunit 2b [Strombidium cf. sulcatum]QPL15958.1 NADH dehydrogenase subunit 2b [Strombidium cf. sulcatum]
MMLYYNLISDSTIFITTYFLIYNLTLILFFWTLFNMYLYKIKTLNLFSYFSSKPFYLLLMSVVILSLAGVPPFIGFFSKLFILQLVFNSKFFLLIVIFFINLLVSLYFYVQNLKYLHTITNNYQPTPHIVNHEKISVYYHYFSIFTLLIIVNGFNYIDDILVYTYWITI